jgi:hypothetical protein
MAMAQQSSWEWYQAVSDKGVTRSVNVVSGEHVVTNPIQPAARVSGRGTLATRLGIGPLQPQPHTPTELKMGCAWLAVAGGSPLGTLYREQHLVPGLLGGGGWWLGTVAFSGCYARLWRWWCWWVGC